MPLVFRIARAAPSQASEIAAVYVHTRRLAYAPFFPAAALTAMSVDIETERWRQRIDEADAETIVALDPGGAIAGFTHIGWQDETAPDIGEVEYMYVATAYQGKGLGATLMAEAEVALAAAGMLDAVLWVYEDNTPARGFYARCGWQPDGARRASDSAPGLYLARYRKRLG